MLARVYSCAVICLDGVEADYTSGFPGMTIVGLPDAAIQESLECVEAAGGFFAPGGSAGRDFLQYC
jgi:magnesium chelatase family protein